MEETKVEKKVVDNEYEHRRSLLSPVGAKPKPKEEPKKKVKK